LIPEGDDSQLGPIRRRKKGGKGQSARKIMEEKLIIAVFQSCMTLFVYRDIKKKHDSWRKVADLVGVSRELYYGYM